jgi:hypothetical protein
MANVNECGENCDYCYGSTCKCSYCKIEKCRNTKCLWYAKMKTFAKYEKYGADIKIYLCLFCEKILLNK